MIFVEQSFGVQHIMFFYRIRDHKRDSAVLSCVRIVEPLFAARLRGIVLLIVPTAILCPQGSKY